MRQIFLDTETTGLYPNQGHRIIEIAAVELFNRRPTQQHFHVYLNPEREIDPGAQEVHGITLEFLSDKPLFADIADAFLDFIGTDELIIHNAPFDVGFINAEFGRIGRPDLHKNVTDTLKIAKEMRPGQRNNLDALCRHYGIDNTKRTLHGALLDAELLADVYMAMTRGQDSLMMELESKPDESSVKANLARGKLKVVRASDAEQIEHTAYLAGLAKSGGALWEKLA